MLHEGQFHFAVLQDVAVLAQPLETIRRQVGTLQQSQRGVLRKSRITQSAFKSPGLKLLDGTADVFAISDSRAFFVALNS